MISLDQLNQLRTVAARWKASYGRDNYKLHDGTTAGEIHAALLALNPESATPEDVAQIIGNKSWCAPQTCHECEAETWDCVQLGEEPDYESSTATICRGCLGAALALLDGGATTGNEPGNV